MWELCGIFVWCRFQQNIFEKVVYKPVYKAYNKRTEGFVFFCLDENGARMAFEPAGPLDTYWRKNMGRAMVFIDFENFNIAMMNYYRKIEEPSPRLDYNNLPKEIVSLLPGNHTLEKTFLCAPKPDEFLMQDDRRKNTYNWINGLKNQKYFTVIEGQHIARKVYGKEMDIHDRSTYYVEEKGTDTNMGVHLVAKGFLNAYDVAIIVSGDSDYIPALEILNTIGKITVVVGVNGQNMTKLKSCADDVLILNKDFFDRCLRE